MKELLLYALSSFAVALALTPFIIMGLRRLKAGQEILKYVDWHKSKGGTPTMGGLIFIIPLILLSFFILGSKTPLCNIAVLASVSYGVLGFLDDYLKIKHKDNLGLRAYQKIIGQGGIAILVAIFYYMANPEGLIFVPFLNVTWNLGFWIAPITFFVLVATTNAVNLTDGVDGLAGSVSMWYLVILGCLTILLGKFTPVIESKTITIIIAIMCGSLLCYLLFNSNKARVFMGDTGSLFLGGLVATLSMFSGLGIVILILGAVFVWSALSVIIQVAYFKYTKKRYGAGKRIFTMAPFHHHLEKSGWGEARIGTLYTTITILIGVVCVLSML